MGDCYRSNIGESSVISSWLGIHWTMSHSFVEISVILYLWGCFWGLSAVPSCKSRLLICFIGNLELLCTQFRGIRPHLSPRGKSHCFSHVAVGTWVIFSSYGRCGHSKLVSVKRGQESCLVTMDTSGIKTRLGRRIQTLLEVRLETEGHFLIGTVIFGYLTIFKKCQASSTFEALYSASLSMCQRDVRPIVQMRWRPSAFSRVSTGDSGIL